MSKDCIVYACLTCSRYDTQLYDISVQLHRLWPFCQKLIVFRSFYKNKFFYHVKGEKYICLYESNIHLFKLAGFFPDHVHLFFLLVGLSCMIDVLLVILKFAMVSGDLSW